MLLCPPTAKASCLRTSRFEGPHLGHILDLQVEVLRPCDLALFCCLICYALGFKLCSGQRPDYLCEEELVATITLACTPLLAIEGATQLGGAAGLSRNSRSAPAY